MPLQALRRRSLAWFALGLLWLAALLPALSQSVLAQPLREGWVQVCSGSGMVWVRADWQAKLAAPAPAAADPAHEPAAAPACDWCLKHQVAQALGPATAPVLHAPVARRALAAQAAQCVGHPQGWPPAQARAPPAGLAVRL